MVTGGDDGHAAVGGGTGDVPGGTGDAPGGVADDRRLVMAPHLRGLEPDPHRGVEVDQKSPGELDEAVPRGEFIRSVVGTIAGLAVAGLVYLVMPGDLEHNARLTAAVAVLLGIWWMTECIPIPATALVPLIAFPVLGEDISVDDVGAQYGNNIIFLFMGGFLIAIAMQRWNLHRRIALLTVRAMGTRSTRVIAGFMIATGFLSMWVSNTATAVMMLPIGVSVLMLASELGGSGDGDGKTAMPEMDPQADPDSDAVKEAVIRSNFGTALMLGIAYAASVGSLATIIGTPPNTLLAGYLSAEHDIQLGFGQWMLVGLPLAVVMLVITWLLLTKVLFRPEIERIPGGRKLFDDELRRLGPTSSGEKRVLVVFAAAAVAWVAVPLVFEEPPISDAGIALAAGLLLFLLPAGSQRGVRLLTWDAALALPWGVLLLFGGGLALSSQFSGSGLTDWIGEQAGALGALPVILLVVVATTGIIFLTELTSNTATAATFLPVAGGVALGLGLDPMLLAVPVALAATCAFMLPVATPPNAIAYGSGYVTIGQMIRGGLWLNLIGILLITLVTMTLLVWVFGLTV
ncbi:DASS family sodium-coupled anion symporter [Dietzia cinnamea]|nr:DASS family sodium-coupled anion symporter [Dietzia cinnamea]MCT2057636.1 DASS family sodium-coupled anion symporter [Dietzia cinnamea]MCT2120370.1 DASS family sodium-coupled anion symporter [Dietzia cinnamea]MCT2145282.1 DASS family sodium-coupled anion symporter [Dietzia cinnamea]MCT2303640.1 DASS family sodium-coupled anion symporter [Dietzia cinnamea]